MEVPVLDAIFSEEKNLKNLVKVNVYGLLTLTEPRPRNWVQDPMASVTVSVSVWCVLFHTLLYNPFFIGLGLGHWQCEQAVIPATLFVIVSSD